VKGGPGRVGSAPERTVLKVAREVSRAGRANEMDKGGGTPPKCFKAQSILTGFEFL
jgi:hypothetical protein